MLPSRVSVQWVRLVWSGWRLVVTGHLALVEWKLLVLEGLRLRHADNETTAQKVEDEATRLFAFWDARGVESLRDLAAEINVEWYWKPRANRKTKLGKVSESTAKNRQWTALEVLKTFEQLGADIDPHALIGERVARPKDYSSTRPLIDDEAQIIRRRAESKLAKSKIGVLVGVSYCGSTAKEAAALRLRDIDLDARTVSFSGRSPRVNSLDEWTVTMLRRFLANQSGSPLGSDDLLCVSEDTGPTRGAQSVTVRLGRLMKEAGLTGRPGVSARSIRLTTARHILDADGIEAAAKFLGSRSLDTVAAALRHDWERDDG